MPAPWRACSDWYQPWYWVASSPWASWRRPRGKRPGCASWICRNCIEPMKKPGDAGLLRCLRGTCGLVAHLLLQVFPAFLRIDGALGGQARFQAFQADLLAGVDAETVIAAVHALERAVDLAD